MGYGHFQITVVLISCNVVPVAGLVHSWASLLLPDLLKCVNATLSGCLVLKESLRPNGDRVAARQQGLMFTGPPK